MLRTPVIATEEMWHVSTGSAAVLGLCRARIDAPSTTAYVMLGARCANDCAFCAQAATSTATDDALARVAWPPFPADDAAASIVDAYRRGDIGRVCFQVTGSAGSHALVRDAVARVSRVADIPICVSVSLASFEEVSMLLHAGAQRVTVPLDAATPEIHARVKAGAWRQTWQLLASAARLYPGHIGTHLIAGLGETEEQLLATTHALLRLGITVGLFAFTPVKGTRMAANPPPALDSYRRVQAGLWLMSQGLVPFEEIRFDAAGRLADYGMTGDALAVLLQSGEAFRTAGCSDCNRPYYNERPSGPLYNYPFPLSDEQARREIALLLDSLTG